MRAEHKEERSQGDARVRGEEGRANVSWGNAESGGRRSTRAGVEAGEVTRGVVDEERRAALWRVPLLAHPLTNEVVRERVRL